MDLRSVISSYTEERTKYRKKILLSIHLDDCNFMSNFSKVKSFTHLSSVCVGLLPPISV